MNCVGVTCQMSVFHNLRS